MGRGGAGLGSGSGENFRYPVILTSHVCNSCGFCALQAVVAALKKLNKKYRTVTSAHTLVTAVSPACNLQLLCFAVLTQGLVRGERGC